jgi:hypothetical protein
MARLIAIAWLMSLAIVMPAAAQDEPAAEQDLTLPPTIADDSQPLPAQLEPAPEEREDMLEAVVTGGQTDFRLPDLGTSLREEQETRDPNQRIDVTFLNLFDPENQDPAEEIFPSLEDQIEERFGVGTLRIFELRFGRDPEE